MKNTEETGYWICYPKLVTIIYPEINKFTDNQWQRINIYRDDGDTLSRLINKDDTLDYP